MLKAAGAILVIFACTALGYAQSLTFQKRLGCLEEIRKMTVLLLGEITYRKEALPQAMERVSGKVAAPLSEFLKEVSREAGNCQGVRFSQIFAGRAQTFFKDSGMTRQDTESFAQLGEYLGYMDVTMQQNTIQLYLKELELQILQAQKEEPVKTKLYRSMGTMGGIFLAVMLL